MPRRSPAAREGDEAHQGAAVGGVVARILFQQHGSHAGAVRRILEARIVTFAVIGPGAGVVAVVDRGAGQHVAARNRQGQAGGENENGNLSHDLSFVMEAALCRHYTGLQTHHYGIICAAGSRVDVRVCSPGQVRKEAAQVDGSGSLGSFFNHWCDDMGGLTA